MASKLTALLGRFYTAKTHSGLPNAATQASHGKGWAHYLGRLTEAASGRDPGPDRGPSGTRNLDVAP